MEHVFDQEMFDLSIATQHDLFALTMAQQDAPPSLSDRHLRAKALQFLPPPLSPSPSSPSPSSPASPADARKPHPQRWYCSSKSKLTVLAGVCNTTVIIYFSSRLSSPFTFPPGPASATTATTTNSPRKNGQDQTVRKYLFSFASRQLAESFCYDTILPQDNIFRLFVSPTFRSAAISMSHSVLDKQQLSQLMRRVVTKQTKQITHSAVVLQRCWRRYKRLDFVVGAVGAKLPVAPPTTSTPTKRKRGRRITPGSQALRKRRSLAAIKIQSVFRRHLATKLAQLRRKQLRRLEHAIVPLQRAVRLRLQTKRAQQVLSRFFARGLAPYRERQAQHAFYRDLSRQILDYYEANLDLFESKLRPKYDQVLTTIRGILWNVSPITTTCEAFGSTTTRGLALPTSDLDVVIHNCGLTPAEFYEVLKRHTEFATHVQLVRAGGMFVIKLQTVQLISVDVSFGNAKQHMGNSHSQFVQTLLGQYPNQLAPLVLVLKQFLRKHQLNSPFTGGLSSIATVLMVWIYLRAQPPCVAQRPVGELLLGLLDLYGQPGFFARYGLCASRGVYELGATTPAATAQGADGVVVVPAAAHIQDPLREGNNLSFGMYRASQVSSCLAYAASLLRAKRGDSGVLARELL